MLNKKRMWLSAGIIIVLGMIISGMLSRQKETIRRRPSAVRQNPIKILTVKNGDVQLPIDITGGIAVFAIACETPESPTACSIPAIRAFSSDDNVSKSSAPDVSIPVITDRLAL